MRFVKHIISALVIGVAATASVSTVSAAETTYNVGSTPTGMPFTYLDPQTNKIVGIMVDFIDAIGKDVGFKPVIQPITFSSLISSLNTKRIDIISAAMIITDERKKVVDFTQPILHYGEAAVVRDSDQKQYTSFADMKGLTVGIQLGTAYVEPAQKSGAFKEIKQYDSSANMLKDLQNKRVDVVLLDSPIAAATLKQPQFKGMHIVESYKPTIIRGVGLATRKDDKALNDTLNNSITKLKANGTVAAILQHWGLKDAAD